MVVVHVGDGWWVVIGGEWCSLMVVVDSGRGCCGGLSRAVNSDCG